VQVAAPADAWYRPTAQLAQLLAADTEKVPAEQVMHVACPVAAAYVPAVQFAQPLALLLAKVPVAHELQLEDIDPVAERYCPAEHSVHDVADVFTWNVPAPQEAHEVAPEALAYIPASHSLQAPWELES
jgi:hypothetical protein